MTDIKKQNDEILEIIKQASSSDNCTLSRSTFLQEITSKSIVKLAFDTRRLDHETYYNPRRNLQHYHRSEQFVSEAMNESIGLFSKLKIVVDFLKEKYEKTDEWKDSYLRNLSSNLDKCLRKGIDDEEYSESQNSLSSIHYIKEILFNRYRLTPEDLDKLSDVELEGRLLAKDPELKSLSISSKKQNTISKQEVSGSSYNELLGKLFSLPEVSKDLKEVSRTITITITDKVKED